MNELANKVAIVTGGTGGLGGAVVAAFLRAGASVAVPFHSDGALDRLREREKLGADAKLDGARVDLGDEDAVARFHRGVSEKHGGFDIVVNCAGGFDGGKPVHQTPWSVWQQQLEINLKTTVLSCKSAIPYLLARGGGSIVNVASRAATQPSGNYAAYAASKRALVQLTEALAQELAPHAITANVVLPSLIDTPSNREQGMTKGAVSPSAIAAVIVFLAGDDARIVSGASIPVYGAAVG